MPSVETTSFPELTAKQSVEAAKRFARDVMSEAEFRYPRLEAVELSGDNAYWLVTISYAPDEDPEDLAREMIDAHAHYRCCLIPTYYWSS